MPYIYTVVITVQDRNEDDDLRTKPELLTEIADQLEVLSDYLNTAAEDYDENSPDMGVVDWTDIHTQTTIKSSWNSPS
jgi:hypothetical protein